MTVRRTGNKCECHFARHSAFRNTFEELLLQLCLCDFNFDGLVHLLVVPPTMVLVVFDGGREESVDESGLS